MYSLSLSLSLSLSVTLTLPPPLSLLLPLSRLVLLRKHTHPNPMQRASNWRKYPFVSVCVYLCKAVKKKREREKGDFIVKKNQEKKKTKNIKNAKTRK